MSKQQPEYILQKKSMCLFKSTIQRRALFKRYDSKRKTKRKTSNTK